ncbi:MAG: spore coat protein A [Halovenus sp.]|jgi:spore coat protein A
MNRRSVVSEADLSRRKYVLAAGAAGLSVLSGCLIGELESSTENGTASPEQPSAAGHSSPELARWVDELSRPPTVDPVGTRDGQPYYEIEMRETEQKLHRDLPATTVWGYNGQYPGPTIEAQQGEPIYVRWSNALPDTHLLPVDTTIHADDVPYDSTGVRTVTHLHGGNTEADSDGHSQAWFTRGFQQTGPTFEKKDYYYVNDQPPATLWYHDHSLGITRVNVYAGLAGLYLLRGDHEQSLGLPAGEYEIPLVLQDRSVNEDGSLYYPSGPTSQGETANELPEPSIVPQFYGDVSVVNGTAWPRLSVEPRKYRFRILNGANSRYYNLELRRYDESTGETVGEGPVFTQIGTDGGLLSRPVEIETRLELGSSKRADVVVDFADYAGETLLLHNNAPAMYRGVTEKSDPTGSLTDIMLVDVDGSVGGTDTSRIPNSLTEVPKLSLDGVDNRRYLPLVQSADDDGRPMFLLGTEENPSGWRLTDPVTESPTLGETELWTVANLTGMSHPIHLHLVHFQVLGRESTEYDPATDSVDPDTLRDPDRAERGWNDVVSVDPGEVVHLLAHFGEYDGLFNDQTGTYMWHCHMLEHEEHDMMRPIEVVPGTDTAQRNKDSKQPTTDG